ncbi:MAG: hypothetical protein AAGG45_04825 [Pseudomonadota bacterium]
MKPFALIEPEALSQPVVRDMKLEETLLENDKAFFKRRGIDLRAYMSETNALDTRTSYQKSTGTPRGTNPPYSDSDLDDHTKLDKPTDES